MLKGPVVLFHGGIRYYQYPVILKESPALPFDSMEIGKIVQQQSAAMVSLLAHHDCRAGDIRIGQYSDLSKLSDTMVVLGNLEMVNCSIEGKLIVVSGTAVFDKNASITTSTIYAERMEIGTIHSSGSVFIAQK